MMNDPHADLSPLLTGAPLSSATYALVLVHGRGGSAESMVPLEIGRAHV